LEPVDGPIMMQTVALYTTPVYTPLSTPPRFLNRVYTPFTPLYPLTPPKGVYEGGIDAVYEGGIDAGIDAVYEGGIDAV
jgi:hypothetical protein